MSSNKLRSLGFTIVELLVAIVVVGVLASIVLISYTGVRQRAIQASLQSDLTNASNLLKIYQTDNSSYPNSINDCPSPTTGNVCVKLSFGNALLDYSANNASNPQTFTISLMGGESVYTINNDSKPTELSHAPSSPVADWLATSQGDHYGNFYDLVSKGYATVARPSTKTVYDPATQKIHDVPANYLALRPRTDGRRGNEVIIEEGKTNYLAYSSLENDSDSDGRADGIGGPWGPGISSYSKQLVSGGAVYGSKYQKFSNITSSSNTVFQMYTNQMSGFSAGESATCSAYVSGDSTGATFVVRTRAYQDGTTLGEVGPSYVLTDKFNRVEAPYASLPANTNKVMCLYQLSGVDPGDLLTMNLDAIQLEKGNVATSYIPTVALSASRSADVVTIPASSWSASTGTIMALASNPIETATTRRLVAWYKDTVNRITLGTGAGNACMIVQAALLKNPCTSMSASPNVFTGRWLDGGSTGMSVYGSIGSSQTGTTSPTGMPAMAYIGSRDGNLDPYNSSVQRIIIYTSFLSDADVDSVSNLIKNAL